MIKFESEQEAREFYRKFINNGFENLFIMDIEKNNYIKKSPLELAREVIFDIKNSAYEQSFYEKHQRAIEPLTEQLNILIEGFNELEKEIQCLKESKNEN